MTLRRLRTLMLREARATLRSPFTVFVMIAVPIGSLLAFGFVVSTEVHGIRLGVLDASASATSRRIVAELEAQGSFEPILFERRRDLEEAMVAGGIGAAILLPPDLERQRARGPGDDRGAAVQVWYDGAEPVLAGNAEAFLVGIVRGAVDAATGAGEVRIVGAPARVRATVRAVFNPTLDGRPYMVAGTFGFVLTFLTTLITAVSIVNERLTGTFEQLQLTPATSLEILLGKMLPLGAVFSFDLLLMMLVAGVVLDTWPVGNPLLFWSVSAFYVCTSLSLGLIFSATSSTAAEAVQKTVLSSIPLIQLSGFIYPVRSMPEPVQWVAQAIPATHFLEISRAIYLRGEGIDELWGEVLIVVAMGLALVALALRTLEKRA